MSGNRTPKSTAAALREASANQTQPTNQEKPPHPWFIKGYVLGYPRPQMRMPRSIAKNPNDPDGDMEYIRGQLTGAKNAREGKPALYTNANIKHNGGRRRSRKQRGRKQRSRRASRKQRGGKAWYEFWKSDEPAEDVPQNVAPPVPAAPVAPVAPAPMAPAPSPNAPKMRRRKN